MSSRNERQYERIMRRRKLLEVLEEMQYRGVPQCRLAEAIGVSPVRISLWKTGRSRIPDRFLEKIEKYGEYIRKVVGDLTPIPNVRLRDYVYLVRARTVPELKSILNEERAMKLDDGDLLDLERLVSRLRQLTEERSRIPVHSGSATSDVRRANRARRRELAEEIYEVEREIIGWALAVVPTKLEEEEP